MLVLGIGFNMHIHIDPVGGVAGDMFAAAILHARPDLHSALLEQLAKLPIDEEVFYSVFDYADSSLCGLRVEVICEEAGNHHVHRSCADIFALIDKSDLIAEIKNGAKEIFSILAVAEAQVHGVSPSEVCFHEVGAIDSIVDIVAASALLYFLKCRSFSLTSLPLGSGLVHSAHGLLPVPAPAAALLLKGFPCHDDGISGERVTPTGAAILCYLRQNFTEKKSSGSMQATGLGFGAKRLSGLANLCRISLFSMADNQDFGNDEVGLIEFELDDQTPEELAYTVENLRQLPEVLDLITWPTSGKKGRPIFSLRILCRPMDIEKVAQYCFQYSSTIGLRYSVQSRYILSRSTKQVQIDTLDIPVKVIDRVGHLTAKAEFDSLKTAKSLAEVRRLARLAEKEAMELCLSE